MTNKEYMKKIFDGEVDDDGAELEWIACYHIACPYSEYDYRAECKNREDEISDDLFGLCTKCKLKWLEREVDV